MKYIIILIIIITIIVINKLSTKIDKFASENNIIPTFHILIATNGRYSLINLLDSLRDQLTKNDAITIVFDGPDAYKNSNYNDSWIKNHISQINIIIEPSNLGYWGHPIRNKYVSLLNPKTTFIMHADDNKFYLPNSFDKLRKLCINPNTLYIAKIIVENSIVIPRQNKIIRGDIDTAAGIIPFDIAPQGIWKNEYGGDFSYYDTLQHNINNITFLDTIIYTKIDVEKFNDTELLNELISYNLKYVDENNNIINHLKEETIEQLFAIKYIKPDDVVLELGARYGTVSCIVNKILNNKNNLVSVEPDKNVWNALDLNLTNNKCNTNLVKGFISKQLLSLNNNGYGSTQQVDYNTTTPNYTLDQIKEKYKILNFTVLIVDCEGCMESFLNENPEILSTLRLVTFEEDQAHICNYDNIKKILTQNNLYEVESKFDGCNRTVWIKRT
jgi:FkbM family methyltransferase